MTVQSVKSKTKPVVAQCHTNPLNRWKAVMRATIRSNPNKLYAAEQQQALRWIEDGSKDSLRLLYRMADSWGSRTYPDADSHYCMNQLAVLVLKYPFPFDIIGDNKTPTKRAVETFLKSEEACRRSNRRLHNLFERGYKGRFAPLLLYMRRWIEHTIGSEPSRDRLQGAFGSGSNVGVHGNAVHLAKKLESEWTVTPNAARLFREIASRDAQLVCYLLSGGDPSKIVCLDSQRFKAEIDRRIKLIDYNLLSFVPKNAKTDRSIAIEPVLNTYVQKGVDELLRKHLQRAGYDLTDQTRNQRYARIGSWDGKFSTFDLKSASDSISIALAKLMLPYGWYRLLDDVRSPMYEYEGVQKRYQKFTSMGNGFCFPLQTLLFAAATRAAIWGSRAEDKRNCVYGDDIIVTCGAGPLLHSLLSFLGLTVNVEKTYTTGPFRESCGADWYEGQDVRPVYMDYPLGTDAEVRVFHNLTRRGLRQELFFQAVRPMLRAMVPERDRFLRPEGERPGSYRGLSDFERFSKNGAFDVPRDVFMASSFARWDRCTWSWRWREIAYRPVKDKDSYNPYAQYLLLLAGQTGGVPALRFRTRQKVVLL